MSGVLSVLVVEDVPLASQKLVMLLQAHPDLRVDATASTLAQAETLLRARRFDLLLLDIGLPDGSGLALAARWPTLAVHTIFITAHTQHALHSYTLGAADYLLKPVDPDRLTSALARARQLIGPRADAAPCGVRLQVRQGQQVHWIDPAQIDYIDMAGHYACVHVGAQVHLLRESIAQLAEQLAPAGLVRVHRSVLVHPARVQALHERRNGDAQLQLSVGVSVPLSRTYRPLLDEALPSP